MTDRSFVLAAAILRAGKSDKARLIANVILELTFAARSKYAEDGSRARPIMDEIEAINKVSGYLIKILEEKELTSEHYLAEMLAFVIEGHKSKGMERIADAFRAL